MGPYMYPYVGVVLVVVLILAFVLRSVYRLLLGENMYTDLTLVFMSVYPDVIEICWL